MFLQFPTVKMLGIGFQTWCSNFTTIQRWMSLKSSFNLDMFSGLREKERILGRRKEKTKLKEWTVVKVTVWPNISLFIPRVLTTYYFIYFYYFIKTNFILFVIKCTYKIPFYFLSNYYFNTLISLYLFNYKNLIIKLYLFTNNNSF